MRNIDMTREKWVRGRDEPEEVHCQIEDPVQVPHACMYAAVHAQCHYHSCHLFITPPPSLNLHHQGVLPGHRGHVKEQHELVVTGNRHLLINDLYR